MEDEIKKPTQETVQKSSEKSSEKILKLIEINNFITISELAEIIGISTRAIEKQINRLQNDNKIIHVGPDKGGHWNIVLNAINTNTVEETVEEIILKLILQRSSITTKELAIETKLSRRGVEYQLNKLKLDGKIQRSGSTKSGQWVIISDKTE